MARGDHPRPFVRRLPGIGAGTVCVHRPGSAPSARHPGLPLTLLALAALVTLFALFLAMPPDPAPAATETQWVLTQTLVNPEKAKLEFRGGGSDPEFFGEERFKGMVMIYKPSATSFSIKDRWQDRDYIAWDVTITCNFSAPETTLVPGKPYKLTATFSHSGTLKDVHPGEAFFYYSPEFYFDPDDSLRYYPSDPNTASSMSWSFTAPSASPGATMQIQAGMSNAPACTVIWKYEARAVASGSTTSTTKSSTTTSSSSTTESSTTTSRTTTADTIPRRWSDAEFEKRLDDLLSRVPAKWQGTPVDQGFIGVVIGATGGDDCRIYDYSGRRVPGPASGRWIRLGDTLQTGPNGRMRVELCDRDDARNAGPSVINISINSELAFDSFAWGEGGGSKWISLIRGTIRTFFRGFGRDSSFSVRAGVAVCGIRGSDVIVSYDPDQEIVRASVHEGHMDVASSPSGETRSLVAGQHMLVEDGELGAVVPMSDDMWGDMVERLGVEDMQPLSAEEWEAVWAEATTTTAPPTTAGTTRTTAPSAGQGTTGGQQSPTFTQAEFEKMLADVAAFAKDKVGRGLLYEEDLLKEGYVGLLGPASGEFSLYDYAGREVDLSVPGTDMDDRGRLLPIRIGDTIKTGAGQAIVYLFACYRTERLMLEVDSHTEVVFASTVNPLNDISATVPRIIWGMVRARRHSDHSAGGGVFSLEAGGTVFPVGTVTSRADVVILHYPEKSVTTVWVHEGNADFTRPGTGETTYVGDGSGWVIENGDDGSYRPLTDDLWDDITLSSTIDDVKACKVVAVTESGRPDDRPLVMVEFERSNLALILAVVIPVVVVVAAAGVGIYLLRRRRRATGGEAPPAGTPATVDTPGPASATAVPAAAPAVVPPPSVDTPASDDTPAPTPSFCRDCGSPIRPGTLFCEKCGRKL